MKSMFIAQIQAKLPESVDEGELISNSGRWRGELGLLQVGPIWMRLGRMGRVFQNREVEN